MQTYNTLDEFIESHDENDRDRLSTFLEVYDEDPHPSVGGTLRYSLMQMDYKKENKKLMSFFGFKSKGDFKVWRRDLDYAGKRRIEWTAGFLFKFYGDDHLYTLVDKHGVEPKRFD